MLNHVELLGRLAEHPELKHTPKGTPVVSFDLAVQSKSKDAQPDYFPIVCWEKLAEFVDRHLSKGRQIVVEGKLKSRKWEDKEGRTRKVVEVTATNIYFADSPARENDNQPPTNYPTASAPEDIIDDDDLPF